MNKAFLETTILTDILLKPHDIRIEAKQALKHFVITELPVYAIKEFQGGPYKNYIWMHNKLAITGSFEKSLRALQRMSLTPKKYTTATALEALRQAMSRNEKVTVKEMVAEYGESATLDIIMCDRLRLGLKGLISKAWKDRRKVTTRVVQELSCYQESSPLEKNRTMAHNNKQCVFQKECCLAASLRERKPEITLLMNAVAGLEKKPENTRRYQVLRHFIRTPNREMTEKMCNDLGDAYFALFAPQDAIILTTNIKDHSPLAAALGKQALRPYDNK